VRRETRDPADGTPISSVERNNDLVLVTGSSKDQLEILPVPDFRLWNKQTLAQQPRVSTREDPSAVRRDFNYCHGHAHFNFPDKALACDSMVAGCLAEASAYVVTAASKGRLAPWTCKHMQAAPRCDQ
jgi:hypothetical protein